MSNSPDPHPQRPPRPEDLLATYAECIDAGDFDGVGALFADAAILDPSGAEVARGARSVSRLFEATTRRFEDGTPRTKHVTTNAIVEDGPDDGEVTVRSYFVVLQQVDGGALQPIVAGRYRDRMAFVDGGWRFHERRMLPELFGDVSHHLLFDPSELTTSPDPS
jgi:3-phenylpropionate/cinnamic acid dioxygenase small subunit